MSDIENKVTDLEKEHQFHNVYEPKCSTCFSNALKIPVGDRANLLIDNPIEVDGNNLEVDSYDYDKDDADYHANKE